MVTFFRKWRSRRERARRERAQFESSVAAFVADSEPDAPSASKYPEAAKYRYAWKRAVALQEIYAERSDQTQVEYYQRVRKRLAEAYFAVAPEGPYGKRKLEIQPDVFVTLKTAELARMSMLFCANCATADTSNPPPISSPIDCPKCGIRFQSGVYILSNVAMPGLVKIGYTAKGLRERLAQLSAATAVPVPFVVEAWFPCSPYFAKRYEKQVHSALASKRVPSREFFEIGVVRAIKSAERIIGCAPECRHLTRHVANGAPEPWDGALILSPSLPASRRR